MTGTEIREFLAYGTRTAKLATVGRGGAPHVMPVWFVLDGGQLVLTTGAESVKGRNLRRDTRVAVVVDDETPPFAFVHIRGRAALSEDDHARRRVVGAGDVEHERRLIERQAARRLLPRLQHRRHEGDHILQGVEEVSETPPHHQAVARLAVLGSVAHGPLVNRTR